MEATSLASLLLSRLASPVIRVDFRTLTRCTAGGPIPLTLAHTHEASLVRRYLTRNSAAVRSALKSLYLAAQTAAGTGPHDGASDGLSRAAFVAFHALLSRALLQNTEVRAESERETPHPEATLTLSPRALALRP